MQYVIVIAMSADPHAASRFEDTIDSLIIDATMAGKIESLTSDVYQGQEAQRLLEKLQEPERQPRRLVEAIIRETGQMIMVEEPEPEAAPDQLMARRLARLGRLGAPEPRPDDGIDRHDVHKRLREQKENQ